MIQTIDSFLPQRHPNAITQILFQKAAKRRCNLKNIKILPKIEKLRILRINQKLQSMLLGILPNSLLFQELHSICPINVSLNNGMFIPANWRTETGCVICFFQNHPVNKQRLKKHTPQSPLDRGDFPDIYLWLFSTSMPRNRPNTCNSFLHFFHFITDVICHSECIARSRWEIIFLTAAPVCW